MGGTLIKTLALLISRSLNIFLVFAIQLLIARYVGMDILGRYVLLNSQILLFGGMLSYALSVELHRVISNDNSHAINLYKSIVLLQIFLGIAACFGATSIYLRGFDDLNFIYWISLFLGATSFALVKIYSATNRALGRYMFSEYPEWIFRPIITIIAIFVLGITATELTDARADIALSISGFGMATAGFLYLKNNIKHVKIIQQKHDNETTDAYSPRKSLQKSIQYRRLPILTISLVVTNLDALTLLPLISLRDGIANVGLLGIAAQFAGLSALASIATDGMWRYKVEATVHNTASATELRQKLGEIAKRHVQTVIWVAPLTALAVYISYPLIKIMYILPDYQILYSILVLISAHFINLAMGPVIIFAVILRLERIIIYAHLTGLVIGIISYLIIDIPGIVPGSLSLALSMITSRLVIKIQTSLTLQKLRS